MILATKRHDVDAEAGKWRRVENTGNIIRVTLHTLPQRIHGQTLIEYFYKHTEKIFQNLNMMSDSVRLYTNKMLDVRAMGYIQ